jgi:hypothetical protein
MRSVIAETATRTDAGALTCVSTCHTIPTRLASATACALRTVATIRTRARRKTRARCFVQVRITTNRTHSSTLCRRFAYNKRDNAFCAACIVRVADVNIKSTVISPQICLAPPTISVGTSAVNGIALMMTTTPPLNPGIFMTAVKSTVTIGCERCCTI